MTFSIKSTLADIAALTLVGVVSIAPLTAQARGLQGHFQGASSTISLQGGTQFSYDERTPTAKTTTRARAKRSGVEVNIFGNKRLFGKSNRSRLSLAERQFQRQNSVNSFNR